MEIFETSLPGVGVRYEFDTDRGRKVGVLVHRDGQRELLIYSEQDCDSCNDIVHLNIQESASLVELLGGTKITERLSDIKHEVQGLSIEWVTVETGSPMAHRTIGDGKIRTTSGASVVAVLRGDESHPGPGPEFLLLPGDTVLITGSIEGVDKARHIVTG